MANRPLPPAYGGPGWQARNAPIKDDLGNLWASCGIDSEWLPLKSVLLHRPGRELAATGGDPTSSLMLQEIDPAAISLQHDDLAQAYRSQGVEVRYVEPSALPPPNQLFAADLFVMTPEGAILGRPASAVRAGEERWVARALAESGIPILRSVGGHGTFEGADLMWLARDKALLASGFRTNESGALQVRAVLEDQGITTYLTQLPPGTMHLMGQLRIVDRDLAIGWSGRLPEDALDVLKTSGFHVAFVPDEAEAKLGFSLNFVVLRPREILMPEGNPKSRAFYEDLGLTCKTVEVGEIGKAAGSIGCLTGILERERTPDGPDAPAP